MRASPISATVNYEEDGVQHGFLKLPYSHDGSAWGSIMIPITVARNGDGPTVLLTGGNHGDEYEGPVALFDLARTIKSEDIIGRVIMVPGMNYPAFRGASRTSPIDKGNMNRVFPGNPAGTVTEKIADYFQRFLLPLADYVLDIHSGGKTLNFVPFCAAHILEDKVQQEKCVAAMRAFNAPFSMMLLEVDAIGMYDSAAEEMGKIFISTELGGGGSTTAESVAIAKKGVKNLLRHAGVLKEELEIEETIELHMPDHQCFISSESTGLLELCVELGEAVSVGQVLARVYDIDRTGSDPAEYVSPLNGIFAARHFPGLIGMGDIVGVVAVKT
ncbi:N(2)-acetyl-L-2,4-diaminobutanoate deacetylase DoeB [Sneathiella sp. HT1-7]|jgi:N-alpha-acetyl-L-2,4-diaminobutyrate deacetylase|uniref:N(2)-acetyl-L-2,4-diaminobutanoate deacetylase DoeB n=1 Tax=Sneathiella sp. HT1-7 TaxID=2887192 RepID=UPI001D141E5A|nr:N(2)-acetyl-L-2,4-diaminobutanoate deacetylase DoeB [Sneathiella sp. HT1-7]MCC3304288.1 N(2)-acetyl-L-2,4-diaminobutanoate deacetylase DoeB [Sneathiella sp. HT1-7]